MVETHASQWNLSPWNLSAGWGPRAVEHFRLPRSVGTHQSTATELFPPWTPMLTSVSEAVVGSMAVDATELAEDLATAGEHELVRLVADWIDRALRAEDLDLSVEPPLDGRSPLDALVAAAAAYVARTRSMPTPNWTIGTSRRSEQFWHPGPPALFPNALVHAPGEFAIRGVFIEAASLVCR